MGHKVSVGDEHYNTMLENAKEDEHEEFAKFYSEKIDSLVSLGNGNRKITEVDKRVEELEDLNKNLVSELDNTNKKLNNLTNIVNQLKEAIMKGDLSFTTPLPDVFAENQEKETKVSLKKHQKAKEIEENLKKL